MGATAGFNFDMWIARYPEFQGTVNQTAATNFFNEACLFHRNDGSGPVRTSQSQQLFLNMLTAHIAQLFIGTNVDPASDGVGRVASASEGSVSASFDLQIPAGTAQWYAQTKYGLEYWAATAAYRTMRYLPGPRRVVNPFFPFVG